MRASTQAAVREHYLAKLRNLYPRDPEAAMVAEAETIMMDNQRLAAYYALLEHGGVHYQTASGLIERVPLQHLNECVRQLTRAA